MSVEFKDTSADDISTILDMLYELGKSDGVEAIQTSKQDLLTHMYLATPLAFAKFITFEAKICGLIIYSWKWAAFTGKKEMYMQAIYILPEFRRLGIAQQAMSLLAKIALSAGCSRIEWYVVKDKSMSNGFYQVIGSQTLEHLAIRRISGDKLTELANRVR